MNLFTLMTQIPYPITTPGRIHLMKDDEIAQEQRREANAERETMPHGTGSTPPMVGSDRVSVTPSHLPEPVAVAPAPIPVPTPAPAIVAPKAPRKPRNLVLKIPVLGKINDKRVRIDYDKAPEDKPYTARRVFAALDYHTTLQAISKAVDAEIKTVEKILQWFVGNGDVKALNNDCFKKA